MNKPDAKKQLLRDIATIISLNDDLMTDTPFDDDGRKSDQWREARDELVKEFERRGS